MDYIDQICYILLETHYIGEIRMVVVVGLGVVVDLVVVVGLVVVVVTIYFRVDRRALLHQWKKKSLWCTHYLVQNNEICDNDSKDCQNKRSMNSKQPRPSQHDWWPRKTCQQCLNIPLFF